MSEQIENEQIENEQAKSEEMNDFDFGKISITAKVVAFFRTFSDIPFANDVSDIIRAKEAFLEIVNMLDSNTSQHFGAELPNEGKVYGPLLEARYESIVELIRNSECTQILELASGFSLRGLAMTREPDYVYVESDLPELNNEKHKVISEIRAKYNLPDFGNHHVVTANALNLEELQATLRPFRTDQNLIVVNEGLLMYLSAAERKIVASNVSEILQKFAGGMWITPDFTTRQLADNVPESVKRFRAAIFGATERQLYDSAFDDEDAINKFFSETGFIPDCRNQLDVVPHLTSMDKLDVSPSIMDRLRPRMRVWMLNPSRIH